MTALSGHLSAWTTLAVVWGVSMTAVSLVLQLRTLKLAPQYTDVAMSLFSGIYNIGIGGGAFLGGLIIAQSSLGLSHIGHVGACVVVLAMMVYAVSMRLDKQR